jgi:hypothetical protein
MRLFTGEVARDMVRKRIADDKGLRHVLDGINTKHIHADLPGICGRWIELDDIESSLSRLFEFVRSYDKRRTNGLLVTVYQLKSGLLLLAKERARMPWGDARRQGPVEALRARQAARKAKQAALESAKQEAERILEVPRGRLLLARPDPSYGSEQSVEDRPAMADDNRPAGLREDELPPVDEASDDGVCLDDDTSVDH